MNLKAGQLEKYCFLLITFISLYPVFTGIVFPTLDGPAHLHNANLINALLFNEQSIIHNFVEINPEPVPNWLGHFLLSFFNLFLPAFIAEKLLFICYIIGLPYSFRSLVNRTHPENRLVSYLIFPFIFSSFFFLGFYNFNLSLILLFFTLSFWLKIYQNNHASTGAVIQLSLLITLTYFSHVFVFVILMAIIGLYLLIGVIHRYAHTRENGSGLRSFFLKQIKFLTLASVIPLLLFANYFFSREASTFNHYLSASDLTKNLTDMSIMKGLMSEEQPLINVLFYTFLMLFIYAIYQRIRSMIRSYKNTTHRRILSLLTSGDTWIVIALVLLAAYYVSPDVNDFGGVISLRIALLFYLSVLVWIIGQRLNKWIQLTVAGIFIIVHFLRIDFYVEKTEGLREYGQKCYELSSAIQPNSVVLPLNYINNWLFLHFSNYIGADKPVIVLENYECTKDYFPLRWKMQTIPSPSIDGKSLQSIGCNHWPYTANQAVKIDYIFVMGNFPEEPDACTSELMRLVQENYHLVSDKGDVKLYQLN